MTSSREAFVVQAMEDYESSLIGYASNLLHDPDRARDVVQDTFIRLCQQDMESVRDHLKSWLFTVCRNRALDLLRKDKPSRPLDDVPWHEIPSPDPSPDELAVREEQMARVMQMLDRLPPNQKQVILLKFHQGLSYREIEQSTGLSSGNIGFLIHTGLKRLRELLK